MSRRLMNLLKNYCEQIEIYSIDEAFISISRPNDKNLHPWARNVRSLIYQNLGITITCLLYTSPSPRDKHRSRMPSSA